MARKMYEIAFELAGKINSSFGGMFSSANERMAQMNRSISSLKTEMKELDAVQKNVARYRGLQEQVAQTGMKFEAARAEVNRLAAELLKAGRPTQELKQRFQEAKTLADSLKNELASQRTELQRLEPALSKAGAFTRNLASDNAKLAAQLKKAERAQQKLAKAINLQNRVSGFRGNMRGNMLDAAGAAVTLGAPVVAAMRFESSMADVRKVVDFETPEQFKAMEKDILNLSKRIPMTAEGLAQIVAAGGQAGLARDELLGYAEAAAKMGVAFDISAEEAGQTMAQWRSAFKMNQEQVNTLADQINYLGNTTAAAAPKISDVVRRIGPLGEVGGAAAAQIAALGATMVGAGITEEVAATGIKNLILGLVAGEGATKSQAEAFAQLGLDAAQMAKLMQEDAQGAILKVMRSLQKLPEYKRAAVLSDLFGKESIGAISPLLTNLEALEENFKKVADATKYAGSMQNEFQARSATSENNVQLLKNRMTALAITTGNILLPPLNQLIGKLSSLAERIEKFSEKHPGLTKAMVIGAAAALGLGIAFTALGYVAGLIISPFVSFYAWATKVELASKLSTVATRAWAAAQWLLNTAMRANPIGLVITAIGGLIAIGAVLYNNFESVRNIVDSVWEKFKTSFPGAAQLIELVGQKVGWLWDKLKGFWRWLTGGKGGGASAGMGDLHMAGYSTGGFAWHPQVASLAERVPEAIIPLDGSTRSLSLWTRAGQMMGALPRGRGDINITFAPVIHAPGGDPGVIRQELKNAQEDFESRFKAFMRQEGRLSYA